MTFATLLVSIVFGALMNMINGGQFKSKDWLPFHPRYLVWPLMGIYFGALFGWQAGVSVFVGGLIYRSMGWRWYLTGNGFLDVENTKEAAQMFTVTLTLGFIPLVYAALTGGSYFAAIPFALTAAALCTLGYAGANYTARKTQTDYIHIAEAIAGCVIGGLSHIYFT